MKQYRIDFRGIEWESSQAGARFKACGLDGCRIRLLEFTHEFEEKNWCTKRHVGYVVDGRLEIDFDGSVVHYSQGDGIYIPGGDASKHKVHIGDGEKALLVLLEEENMKFLNCYEDAQRAEAYAKLEFPGTYYLAYRDLPEIILEHVKGRRAIDFGCGAGRSTRFLRRLGFDVIGVDIAEDMVRRAKAIDPQGDYRLLEREDLGPLEDQNFDLIMSVFTFDNIPTMEKKVNIFGQMGRLLKSDGRIINLVSAPEIYTHEWASFSTKDFPENREARCGDIVKIINTDIEDRRPVEDILWPDEDYRKVYARAGLEVVKTYTPLAKESEPFQWVNETRIAPWAIYVLQKI